MASPARRRRDRIARKRHRLQKEAQAFNKRCGQGLQFVRPEFIPGDLRDVTPRRPAGLITARAEIIE